MLVVERLDAVARAVRACTERVPRLALALAPGLPAPGEVIAGSSAVSADRLPQLFPAYNPDELVLGTLAETAVVAWRTLGESVQPLGSYVSVRGLPVRIAGLLGADILCVVGVAVALTPAGGTSLALVDDHLNLMGANPLVGPNLEVLGPRFPDMTGAYDVSLNETVREVASRRGVALGGGVLAAIPPPSLAARAEYNTLREAGADLVCSAAVPEVIVARHMGMRSFALFVVSEQQLADGRVVAGEGGLAGRAAADAVALLHEVATRFG